jgi:hypothetical protein
MRIIRKQRHQEQQRRRAQDDANDIIQCVRLRLRCIFARHGPTLTPPAPPFKAKLAPEKIFFFLEPFSSPRFIRTRNRNASYKNE